MTERQMRVSKTGHTNYGRQRSTGGNSTFAIGGVSCSADSFVVAESSVLRMNICAEKPAHRKSAKRYSTF
jgi:hypothetical protein